MDFFCNTYQVKLPGFIFGFLVLIYFAKFVIPMLYNTELVVILKWEFLKPYLLIWQFLQPNTMFHSHITKALVCPSMSYIILFTKFALYISKRMSVTVTKTYDDKKETVLTEISILYLTSNKLLLRKSYPCQWLKIFKEDFLRIKI